jgi:RNA polymerase sigma factor (sigma-70 family)
MTNIDHLISNNLKLVDKLISNIAIKYKDDVYGVCMVALVKAAQTFDSAHDVKFETYASRVIRNAIRTDLKRIQKITSRTVVSTDSYIDDDEEIIVSETIANDISIEDDCVIADDRAEKMQIIRQIASTLDETEKEIFSLYANGANNVEIANELHMSKNVVSSTLKKIIERMQYQAQSRIAMRESICH